MLIKYNREAENVYLMFNLIRLGDILKKLFDTGKLDTIFKCKQESYRITRALPILKYFFFVLCVFGCLGDNNDHRIPA